MTVVGGLLWLLYGTLTFTLAYWLGWSGCERRAVQLRLRERERTNAAMFEELQRGDAARYELRECKRALGLANEALAARIAPKPGTWE